MNCFDGFILFLLSHYCGVYACSIYHTIMFNDYILSFEMLNSFFFAPPGVGIGPGFPGMQFGMGFGAGCGVGVGFGYGVGKGIAHDAHRRYSNVGKLFQPQGDASSQ